LSLLVKIEGDPLNRRRRRRRRSLLVEIEGDPVNTRGGGGVVVTRENRGGGCRDVTNLVTVANVTVWRPHLYTPHWSHTSAMVSSLLTALEASIHTSSAQLLLSKASGLQPKIRVLGCFAVNFCEAPCHCTCICLRLQVHASVEQTSFVGRTAASKMMLLTQLCPHQLGLW